MHFQPLPKEVKFILRIKEQKSQMDLVRPGWLSLQQNLHFKKVQQNVPYLWVQFEFRFDAQWVPANLDAILDAIELYSGIEICRICAY